MMPQGGEEADGWELGDRCGLGGGDGARGADARDAPQLRQNRACGGVAVPQSGQKGVAVTPPPAPRG